MKIPDFEYVYFDLDRNIWDTTDKYRNPIWARQLIFPLTKHSDEVYIDDCLSQVQLQDGIIDFLTTLNRNNKKIGYISRGANLNISFTEQPSFKLLQIFDIAKFFNAEHILLHKNQKKYKNISREKFVYFDDSEEEISLMKEHRKESHCILRSDFTNWRDLI